MLTWLLRKKSLPACAFKLATTVSSWPTVSIYFSSEKKKRYVTSPTGLVRKHRMDNIRHLSLLATKPPPFELSVPFSVASRWIVNRALLWDIIFLVGTEKHVRCHFCTRSGQDRLVISCLSTRFASMTRHCAPGTPPRKYHKMQS